MRLSIGLFAAAFVFWLVIDQAAFADEPKPSGSLMQAGYVDQDGRFEFVVPFDAEPQCSCSPGWCADHIHISREDAVLDVMPKLQKGQKPPRIVCWGER
jgi:hypothetical protein